jgi:predicted outer membrane repeat protein
MRLFIFVLAVSFASCWDGDPRAATAEGNGSSLRSDNESRTTNLYLTILLLLSLRPDEELKTNKFRCLYLWGNDCICRERALRRAIRQNRDALICHDTRFKISRPIDITGKSFTLTCDPFTQSNGQQRTACIFTAKGNHRIFVGAPADAKFRNITFKDTTFSGDGGVARLSGGLTLFHGCLFVSNKSTGKGGAISAGGASTVVTAENIFACGNRASKGGCFNIENRAKLTLTAASIQDLSPDNFGGAIHVSNSQVFLTDTDFGLFTFETNTIWIADDEDPSGSGSMVGCDRRIYRRNVIGEFAGGLLGTQLYNNTNCTFLEQVIS